MIADASALVAIVKREADADAFEMALREADQVAMSAANWVEAAIVSDAMDDPAGALRFDGLVSLFSIGIIPVDAAQAELARDAYRRFGKGRHAAGLNFGDCFAYALAKSTGRPLLFKGNDFSKTDVYPALRD